MDGRSPRTAWKVFNYGAGFLILFAAWQAASAFYSSPALPGPSAVLKIAARLLFDPKYVPHIISSLKTVMSGIGIAVFAGLSAGVIIYRYDFVRKAALPIIECVRGVSALSLFPLLIIFFGLGALARILVIFWTAWPSVALSTITSLEVDRNVVDAARVCGASDWQIIFRIRIPMAFYGVITGVRIGFGGGWISLMAAEMLGASKGIGYYLMWSSQSFQYEKVYASIVIIAALGGFMKKALSARQKKYLKIMGG
jgi:NitT/TauT family transport system permease protein